MSPFFRIIASGLTVLSIFFIFRIALKESDKQCSQNDNEIIIVRNPTVFFIVGISATIFFIILGIAMYLFPFGRVTPMWCYIVDSVFVFFFLMFALIMRIWRIDIYSDNDYFVYRTFCGRKYRIEYKDCIFYYQKDGGIKLKAVTNNKTNTKNKYFSISVFAINYEVFLKELNIHNVKKK